jgi:hypothetical protein
LLTNMTIDPFLTNQAFDAKAIREMSFALESVCNALGLHVDDGAARIKVAEKIIELAGHGTGCDTACNSGKGI